MDEHKRHVSMGGDTVIEPTDDPESPLARPRRPIPGTPGSINTPSIVARILRSRGSPEERQRRYPELQGHGRNLMRDMPAMPLRRRSSWPRMRRDSGQLGEFGANPEPAELNDPPVLWRSLCLTMDPRAVVFFSQIIIMLLVLVFCMYQLFTIGDPSKQQFYSGTITFILGIVLPAPRYTRRDT